MEIRPYRKIIRKKTKKIKVGNISVGGDSPISVQSMTNTLTTDTKATIKQIDMLQEAGADIVRVSCPDEDSTKALKNIVKETNIPIVAIGGIKMDNYKKLLLNKANFLAISGYVWNNKKYKPIEAIKKFK